MFFTEYIFDPRLYTTIHEQFTDDDSQFQNPGQPEGDPSPVNPPVNPMGDPYAEMDPQQDGMDQGGGQPGGVPPPQPEETEFENIKKYILYDKMKVLRHYLKDSDIDHDDPDILSMVEFLDLVLLFYNSFGYFELTKIIESIIQNLSDKLKIKLPSLLDDLKDEDDENQDEIGGIADGQPGMMQSA